MIELIAKKLHDALGVTVYTETVPQGLESPSVSVFPKEKTVIGRCGEWMIVTAEFRAVVRDVPFEAVADALAFVTDRDGGIYRGEAIRTSENEERAEVSVRFRYRARVDECAEAAPLMQVMTQKTEV